MLPVDVAHVWSTGFRVYFDRRDQAREGRFTAARAPGVYSERVQSGGNGYGTIVQPVQ